ncbi:DUF2252 family protein [Tunturibacter empetritectus]|uniref:Uncharacterized protein (DUF2252 family) n=1 Tax=Tunturiibacter empetritectus TaxID=3069691 RepID=A0A7W8MTH8_9BACT|nr:DUF2252 family protein [Edaphobacter lichenicola]MBB5318224.1 uncharacterized protein (DUF2252 family) [Edaphobacter lichenicola]
MRKKVVEIKPADRQAVLEERRRLKMARSAHAYVRGNTRQFYEWLKADSARKLPQGPPVWICGDCHVGNLGPVANSEGKVEIEIRDLDQTVIGNPAHDLIRLGLSLATAARGSDLPGVTTALMMEQMVQGYRSALIPQRAKKVTKDPKNLRPVETVLHQAVNREWQHLAQERIEDVKPTIPLGERFWTLSDEEKEEITKLFKNEAARKLITSLKHRDNDARVRVLDAAYWMKGCSSLGRLRYAVLLGVGPKKDKEYCLVDIKEAVRAAAPAAKNADMPKDFAQRVVTGACNLSPYLGERMLAAKFLSRPVVLRELMPQDLKLEIDRLTREEAVNAASYLACIVGKAHARQMDAATRKHWAAELAKNQSKTLNAPGWMWTSIVELIASHETAYLEHCRLYATA